MTEEQQMEAAIQASIAMAQGGGDQGLYQEAEPVKPTHLIGVDESIFEGMSAEERAMLEAAIGQA